MSFFNVICIANLVNGAQTFRKYHLLYWRMRFAPTDTILLFSKFEIIYSYE